MPHQFQFSVSDNLYKAMQLQYADPDVVLEERTKSEARIAMVLAVAAEVERLLEAGLPVPQTRGEILDSALADQVAP